MCWVLNYMCAKGRWRGWDRDPALEEFIVYYS